MNYIYIISKLNIKDIIDFLFQKTFKLIMLKFSFYKRSLFNFL